MISFNSIILLIATLNSRICNVASVPAISGLSARYDKRSDSIYIEWRFDENSQGVSFAVRYRIGNRPITDGYSHWQYSRTILNHLRLDLPDLRHNDELHVQVRAERGGFVIEDWSQTLIITVSSSRSSQPNADHDHTVVDNHAELESPHNFSVNILSPTSVWLEWIPTNVNMKGIYYIVSVKQLTSKQGKPLQQQEVRVKSSNFTLGNLIPGEQYELTIQSAIGQDLMSNTAAILEIIMPRESEYFEVGQLIITTLFHSNGRGIVNLTWDVPPEMQDKIKSYDVEYAEHDAKIWKTIHVNGTISSVSLNDLKIDTDYIVKVKTMVANNMVTESGRFRFRTPKSLVSFVKKVDVIYSNEADFVRLQWSFEPFISTNDILAYDVFIAANKDLPESQWKYINLASRENSTSINSLKPGTDYYFKINLRKKDGTILRSPNIFRFRTLDRSRNYMEITGQNMLEFFNAGFGRMNISWSYPENIRHIINGSSLHYTDRCDLPLEKWYRLDVHDSKRNSVILGSLKPLTKYTVQIIPKVRKNVDITKLTETFEFITDDATSQRLIHKSGAHLHKSHRSRFQLSSCTPDRIFAKRICRADERCVAQVDNPNRGWCVRDTVR